MDWRDIRIEDLDTEEEEEEEEEEVINPKMTTAPAAPAAMPEEVVDIAGKAIVFIDGR